MPRNAASYIVIKFFFIFINYIRYSPLVFVSCYAAFLVCVIFLGTSFEDSIIYILRLLLNAKETSISLNQNDISGLFFRIWFFIATFYQIIALIFKVKVNNKVVFLIISLALFVLSIFAAIKLSMAGIVMFFYILSVINLGVYYLLSYVVGYFEGLVSKSSIQ
jgi:hypothetical protein